MLFLCFSLCNDLFNHRNIFCISFFNYSLIYYLINIYSDLSQLALKYLKDTEVDPNNVLIITDDFNIRNNFWDSSFPYYSSHRNTLFDIADSFVWKFLNLLNFSLLDISTMFKTQTQFWILFSFILIWQNMTIIIST